MKWFHALRFKNEWCLFCDLASQDLEKFLEELNLSGRSEKNWGTQVYFKGA